MVNEMLTLNATQVRNDWSSVVDSVIREKPAFIKRTRDYMFLSDVSVLEEFLSAYTFHAKTFIENDGSITISLDEIDLVENGVNKAEALSKLSSEILDYSEDYYKDYTFWAKGSRKSHLPYVFRALIVNDPGKIGELIECRPGKN